MFQMTQCCGVLNISSLALRPALEQMMRQPLVKHITWGEVRQQFASWRGKWSWWQMIDKKWFVVGFQRSTIWQFFPWRQWFWWRFWIQKARGQSFLHIVAVFIHIDKCIWPSHITGESMVNRWLHVLRAWRTTQAGISTSQGRVARLARPIFVGSICRARPRSC